MTKEGTQKNSDRLSGVAEVGLVFVYGLCLTWIATRVYPVWDDGWFELFLLETRDIMPYTRDRPLVFSVLQWFIRYDVVYPAAVVLHFLAWTAMGLMALQLWKRLFPSLHQYGVLAAGISMAPMLCTIQLHLLQNTATGQVGPLIVYVAFFLLRPFAKKGGSPMHPAHFVVATSLVVFACLLTDYAIPAGLACCALLAMPQSSAAAYRSRYGVAVLFFFSLVVGYVAYWFLSSAGGRAEVRPELVLDSQGVLYSAAATGFRLLSSLWQGAGGFLLAEVGGMAFHESPEQAMLLLPALLVGVCLYGLTCLRSRATASTGGAAIAPLLRLCMALGLGLVPIVFMRNIAPPNRFWLPLLPVVSCLSLGVLFRVIKPSLRPIVPIMIGILIAHATGMLLIEGIASRDTARSWGQELRPLVATNGMTAAVFIVDDRDDYEPLENGFHTRLTFSGDDYWLTAVMTEGWEPETIRRFWAFSSWVTAAGETSGLHWRGAHDGPTLERSIRGLTRRGPLERILWVKVDRTGGIDIVPENIAP